MRDLEKPYLVTLIDSITHQGIGGQVMRIEKEGTMKYISDMSCDEYTITVHNFIVRRDDIFTIDENMKIYYGHVNNLGYFIAEDEIKEVLKDE